MPLAFILFLAGMMMVLWLFLWLNSRSSAAPAGWDEALLAPVAVSAQAVFVANARGQLIHVNETARRWLKAGDSALDLEAVCAYAEPPDALLDLFAVKAKDAPETAELRFAGRWVRAEIRRDAGGRVVVALSESTAAEAGAPLSRALDITNEIGEMLHAGMGVEQVLQALLSIVRKAVPADAGEICLWDERTRTLQPRGWVGDMSYVLALAEAGGHYAEGEGISGWIARHRKPLLIADRNADTAVPPKLLDSPYLSYVGLPLELGGAFIGTFELASEQRGRFTTGDLAVLQAVSKSLATAIYNAQIYAEQAQRIEDIAALQRAAYSARAQNAADSDTVYAAMNARIAALMEADMCGVLLYDERRGVLSVEGAFHGLPLSIAQAYVMPVPAGSRAHEIFTEDSYWYANDLVDEPLADSLGLTLLINAAGLHNTLLMPLEIGGRRIGLLQVGNKRTHGGFTSRDAQQLRLLAAQAAVIVQDMRLAREEERREREMTGLQEIAQAVGAITHEGEVYSSTTERIARLMDARLCGVLLYDDANRRLAAQTPFYGLDTVRAAHLSIPLPPASAMESIWQQEDYWFSNHLQTDKVAIGAGLAETAAELGIGQVLMAALSSGGRRLGMVLVADKRDGGEFTENDARLLQIFTAQVAGMIENARLFGETQRRADEAERLRRIAEEAGAILTTEDSFAPALSEAARLLRSEAVFVNVLDAASGNLIVYPRYVYGRELAEPIVYNTYERHFEYSVAISRRPFLSNDVLNDARVLPAYRRIAEQFGITRVVMVPLVVGDVTLGEIGAFNRMDEPYTEADIAMLGAVAIQIAGALDRVRLYEASGQNLRRRLQELDAISRVSNELAQTIDFDRVLEVIRSEALRATEAEGNTIALLAPVEEWPEAGRPLLARRLGERRPPSTLAEIELAALARGGEAVLIEDYATTTLNPPAEEVRSAVAAAFFYGDQPVGVIHLYHSEAGHFDQRAAAFLATLASKAALSYASYLRYQENQDRSERLRRRVEQLNQIFELGQMLQSNVDPVTMLEAIAYSVQQSCGFDVVLMTLADEEAGVLRRVTQAGMPVEVFDRTRGMTIPLPTLRALFEKTEFRISESLFLPFERLSHWYVDGLETLSAGFEANRTLHPTHRSDWRDGDMLLVPIPGARGELLGVISLDRPYDDKRPDRTTVEVLEIFAHQAATTLENTRLYTSSLRSAEQEARLNELMEAIASTLDPDEIVESVARGALRLLPFARMTLALVDNDRRGFDIVHVTVKPDETLHIHREARAQIADTALGRTFAEGQDYLYDLEEAAKQPGGLQYNDLLALYREGERTALIVPLITGGLCIGALHFGSDLIRAFGFEEFRPLLKRIANLAAVALVNANLFRTTQTRTQRLAILNNVSLLLAQSLDSENILETALKEIANVLGIAQARAYLFDRETHVARVIVDYPRGDYPPQDVFNLASRESFRRMSALRGPQPVVIGDLGQLPADDPLRVELEARGLRGYLLVPMTIGGQATGAFELDVIDEPYYADPERLDLCVTIANQAAIAVLNANLLEQTLVRTQELETLLEAAQSTSLTRDLHDVYVGVSQLMLQALDMDQCALMLYDDVQEALHVEMSVNRMGDEVRDVIGTTFDLLTHPSKQRAIHEGQIIVLRRDAALQDAREGEAMRAADSALRLLVPLLVRERAIGLLQVDVRSPERAITHREIRMAQALAAQAATAVENARLSAETAAQVEQSLIINELSQSISSTMDIDAMIRVVRNQVPPLVEAEELYLALYDANSGMISFPMAVRRGEPFTIPPRPLGTDEVSFVLRHRRPLTIGGINPAPEELRRNLGITPEEGAGTRYLGVPLAAGDQVIGVLAVRDRHETRPFGLNDHYILTTIGAQLGAAIQNARLFEQVRNFANELNQRVQERTLELQQERDQLDALYRITSELSRSLDMDYVLENALDMVARAIKADDGAVLIVDPLTTHLKTRAQLLQTETGAAAPSHPAEHIANQLLRGRTSLILEDALESSDLREVLHPWRSALGVLLETNEDAQGAMIFFSRLPSMFDEPQLRLVSAAANQVATAINNAELYNLIRDQAESMARLLRAEQEEAQKQTAILEGIADGVLLADASGKVLLFNHAAERLLDLPREQALNHPLEQISDIHSAAWARPLRDWLHDPIRQMDEELVVDRLDVGKRVLSLRASPVSSSGQYLGTVAVFRDITRDVEVDRMKSEFISNVSHELRTPMTSIKGYADLLLMGAGGTPTEEQQRFLQTIKSNADRLAELVDDLLNISRIDTGETLKLEPVDLRALIVETLDAVRGKPAFAGKTLAVMVDTEPDLPRLAADRLKLIQILTNVLDNAFSYTYSGGKIDVTARHERERSRVLISVADTGIGIPEAFRERVWERFERYDEHALVMEVAGTGLGLSIVKHFVEMHRGEVWFESRENQGTTFYIALPVDPAQRADGVSEVTAQDYNRTSSAPVMNRAASNQG